MRGCEFMEIFKMISFVLHLSRLKAINIACISASLAEYIRSHRTSQDLHGHLRPYIDPLPLSSSFFSPLLSSSPLFPISSSTSESAGRKTRETCFGVTMHQYVIPLLCRATQKGRFRVPESLLVSQEKPAQVTNAQTSASLTKKRK